MKLARAAGVFYVLTFVFGISAFTVRGAAGAAAGLAGAAVYVVVTILFYVLFAPVNRPLSLAAAIVSLTGCVNGALATFNLTPVRVNALVFFGVYCLLIGYLVFRSTYLPRAVGVLMALAGIAWLTFASRSFGRALYPWNMIAGMIGEGSLTLWLLIFGVDVGRWTEQGYGGQTPAARMRT